MAQVLAATIATPSGNPDAPFEQRSDARRCLSLQVTGNLDEALDDSRDFNATVRDLSRVGFLMDSTTAMTVGEMIYVELPRLGRVSARVAWTEGRLAGCRFVSPISLGAVSAALLRAVPDAVALVADGPSVRTDPVAEEELSSRQKLAVLLSLSLLSWVVVVAIGYAGLRLLGA
jgi:hypothetical protein